MTSFLPSPLTSATCMNPRSATRGGAAGAAPGAAGATVTGRLTLSQSAWNVQGVERGSAGASAQPRGVRMSVRPSLFTSPAPMPCA